MLILGAFGAASAQANALPRVGSAAEVVAPSSPGTQHGEPSASTTPESGTAPVPMAFDVQGSAEVRTGIRGRVTISGTFRGAYDTSTNRFEGQFSLIPTRARIVVLGLLPVTAETDWSYAKPVTGEWRDGTMRMRIAARIRHPNLYAFGHIRVAGGPNCATRQPSVIELESHATTPIANPLDGGTLRTTGAGFAISPLSGCGPLDTLLSAVAAGGGNHATVQLTPSRLN